MKQENGGLYLITNELPSVFILIIDVQMLNDSLGCSKSDVYVHA